MVDSTQYFENNRDMRISKLDVPSQDWVFRASTLMDSVMRCKSSEIAAPSRICIQEALQPMPLESQLLVGPMLWPYFRGISDGTATLPIPPQSSKGGLC
eukprot:3796828-Amphidinium_carterae.1